MLVNGDGEVPVVGIDDDFICFWLTGEQCVLLQAGTGPLSYILPSNKPQALVGHQRGGQSIVYPDDSAEIVQL